MPIQRELSPAEWGTRVPVKIWTDEVEQEALLQLQRLGRLPFVYRHIAVMPDVHVGLGSTIGSVIATKEAILPAAVGVDLGCGMSAYRIPGLTPPRLEGRLKPLREKLEQRIPVGFGVHRAEEGWRILPKTSRDGLHTRLERIEARARASGGDKILRGLDKSGAQMGTLGGGNHFIELCIGSDQGVYLLLHSGSRGVGNLLAQHHIAIAKTLTEDDLLVQEDRNLAYFKERTPAFEAYIEDMLWAQDFAYWNRRAMGALALTTLVEFFNLQAERGGRLKPEQVDFIDCHHNYVAQEEHFGNKVWVTRKGAVRARSGDRGIIPGSMGAKSFLVTGRGNTDSFCSCSHGAGRRMSRTQAKERYTAEDLRVQTAGVECRKDQGVVDEIPSAYKDIDEVMAQQSDLVSIDVELRQVLCIKG